MAYSPSSNKKPRGKTLGFLVDYLSHAITCDQINNVRISKAIYSPLESHNVAKKIRPEKVLSNISLVTTTALLGAAAAKGYDTGSMNEATPYLIASESLRFASYALFRIGHAFYSAGSYGPPEEPLTSFEQNENPFEIADDSHDDLPPWEKDRDWWKKE